MKKFTLRKKFPKDMYGMDIVVDHCYTWYII